MKLVGAAATRAAGARLAAVVRGGDAIALSIGDLGAGKNPRWSAGWWRRSVAATRPARRSRSCTSTRGS